LPLPALYVSQVLIFVKKHPVYYDKFKFKFTHNNNASNKSSMQFVHHKTAAHEKGLLVAGQPFFNKNSVSIVFFGVFYGAVNSDSVNTCCS